MVKGFGSYFLPRTQASGQSVFQYMKTSEQAGQATKRFHEITHARTSKKHCNPELQAAPKFVFSLDKRLIIRVAFSKRNNHLLKKKDKALSNPNCLPFFSLNNKNQEFGFHTRHILYFFFFFALFQGNKEKQSKWDQI